jgi:hypothetical protein
MPGDDDYKKATERAQKMVAALIWDTAIKRCVQEGGGTRLDCFMKIWEAAKWVWESKPLPPQPDPTRRLLDPKRAEIFRRHLAKAFDEADISLRDDEVFACLICVAPKDPELYRQPRFDYVMQ